MFNLSDSSRALSAVVCLFAFTACEQNFEIKKIFSEVSATASPVGPDPTPASTPNSEICFANPTAAACIKTPVVTTPGVVTILFTMQQIPQGSASLILANAIKYASPSASPKILFLKDSATNGEDEGDAAYIKDVLLLGYDVQYGEIPAGGLAPSTVIGKDLVIVSNPGYPLSDRKTLDTLTAFSGGVILVGDDMAHGSGFNVESFTGLKYSENGSSLSCNGRTYSYDNSNGHQYQVALNSEFLPGVATQYQNYEYGNDLDLTEANDGTEVLAWASAAAGTCNIGKVPAVVRRPR